ncbi:hypothetical protein BGZ70_010597 [Mortierella alpina]|uniref:Uncharacterized protein n=1 Tax=Mortierella alpina TaxID=64518 RepID=A0A9P6LYH8_MORAP|nr:hypothetical protein BGZ70_010597 [Mortierella alpina]
MAVAGFAKDLFEPVELRLEGGEKMYGLLLPGGAQRVGVGSVAYVRHLKHRMDDEIKDLELKIALKAHAFSSLVDVENYEPLGEDDPLCFMPFSEHKKLLVRTLVGLLIQSGDAVLCLKVEVYGRSKSEDPHSLDLALPDGISSFKVANRLHESTSKVMVGTVRWNALVTMTVVVTNGKVVASLAWSGIKVASFVFHQLFTCDKIVKSDVTENLQNVKEEKSRADKDSGIMGDLNKLVEAMQDEETSSVSEPVRKQPIQLAGRLQGDVTEINKTTITEGVVKVIEGMIQGKQNKK